MVILDRRVDYVLDVAGERATIWLSALSDETLMRAFDDLGLEALLPEIPLDDDLDATEATCEAVMWHLRQQILGRWSQP